MSKQLRLPAVPSTVLRYISPGLLLELAEHFSKVDAEAMSTVNWLDYQELRGVGIHNTQNDIAKKRRALLEAFAKAILALKSPESDGLISELHTLYLCISKDVSEKLEQVTGMPQHGRQSEEYIVDTYLREGTAVLRQAYRLGASSRIRRYDYYVPKFQPTLFDNEQAILSPNEPTQERKDEAEKYLSGKFKEYYASPLCKISSALVGERMYLDIIHAGNVLHGDKVDENEEDASVSGYVVHPVEYDLVVLDLPTLNLGIHMENSRPKVMEEYVKVAGSLFFDSKNFWEEAGQKYNLASMATKGKAQLKELLDVETARSLIIPKEEGRAIEGVRLVLAEFSRKGADGTPQTYKRTSDGCLTKDLDTEDERIVDKPNLTVNAVAFCIDSCRTGEGVSTCRIGVTPKSRDEAEALSGVDSWLAHHGFCASQRRFPMPDWFDTLTSEQKAKFTPQILLDDDIDELPRLGLQQGVLDLGLNNRPDK